MSDLFWPSDEKMARLDPFFRSPAVALTLLIAVFCLA